MSENKKLYTGTLIFSIVATVVSIAIVCIYFFLNVEKVKYMLLTIEIILVLIIIHSIITIVMYEKKMKKYYDNKSDKPIQNMSCPDYFTKTIEDNIQYCDNVYETPKTILTIGSLKSQNKIDLSELKINNARDTCAKYNNEYADSIPWTDLKSACETII